jgi:hypothetical protein
MKKLLRVNFSILFLVVGSVALAQALDRFAISVGRHLAEDPEHIATSMIIDLSNAAIQLEVLNTLSARLSREFGAAALEDQFIAEEVSDLVSDIRSLYEDAHSRAIELIDANEGRLSESQAIASRFINLEFSQFGSDLEYLQFVLMGCEAAMAIIDESGLLISDFSLSLLNENREGLALTYSARRDSF